MVDLEILQGGKIKIAEYISDKVLGNAEAIVDLLGNANYLGATSVIVRSEQLHDSFFKLATGVAGELLQKFSNYQCRLAIIGKFDDITSKNLDDFIKESNRYGRIVFVSSKEEAIALLDK